jgi:hypothetical protein
METCSRLEEIANQSRANHLVKNVYQDQSGLKYTNQHPNATQAVGGIDDLLNAKGKGTGGSFDTENGGSYIDVNGLPEIINSGRKAIYNVNQYTPEKKYDCFI